MDIRKGQALRDILKDKSLLKDKCYIAGKWVGGTTTIEVTNPANGDVIVCGSEARRRGDPQAIEAAEKAQKDWAAKTAKERAAILRKWFDLMMENQEDLAQIMTAEQGKPLAEIARRGRLWRVLHRVLRRGGQAHLWRDHSLAMARRRASSSSASRSAWSRRSRRGISPMP